ncbi:RDD family protein [Marilutibacter chinensis]|uniref:RDD family protein n=1 Tax=Marilutibacter chinensis TaxID=2912247 RepID=A0ABS9HTE0_9GAMM|nr:RDD family protein [Lysobacter chinensis]MCF7221568.1 RDD family protein [Lysobacter chinensis]
MDTTTMSQWYYSDTMNRRQGPVGADALAGLHREGRIGPETLVWRDGMANWQPWHTVSAEILSGPPTDPAPIAAAAAGTLAAGTNPYEVVPATATQAAAPASPYAPPGSQLSDQGDFQAGGEIVYAGFWKRFAALAIDNFLIGIAYYALIIVAMIALGIGAGAFGDLDAGSGAAMGGFIGLMAVIYLAYPVLSALYYVSFESSSKQATLGKMAVGIKVTDDTGHRLSRGRALGRWASHLLCYLTLYIGYLMAAFTDRKRGLHDMVAGTLVVDRWAYTASPQLQRRDLGAVTIVIIVLAALVVVAYAAIMLAIAIPAYQGYLERAGGA